MGKMCCKRCGANEDRINGFCSVECEEYYRLEEEINALDNVILERGAAIGRLNTRIAELEAAQRWIPVSEPPKVDGSYLLRTVFDEVYSSDFIAKTETWVLRDYDSVTHWMPLPQPPEVQA